MSHAYILWIAAFAYALHVVEEYMFDWKGWAINVLKLPVDWVIFALVNGVVIVLGISCSSVGWSLPAYALGLPALMFINATFFSRRSISRHERPIFTRPRNGCCLILSDFNLGILWRLP